MKSVEEIAQDLIRFETVTPQENGCFSYIENFLRPLGFMCSRVVYKDVTNFYARLGHQEPHLCFLGHIDVVPPQPEGWRFPPFSGVIENDILFGRGAVDMKGAIASFLYALQHLPQSFEAERSVSLLLTSDEEGPALNGVKKMVPWLLNKKENITVCLVGEPTNPTRLGEMIKVGRRGSFSFIIGIKGVGGHVAYPEYTQNPIHGLCDLIHALNTHVFDGGNDLFDATHLEITHVETDNHVFNMIPSTATLFGNVRFNPLQTFETLEKSIQAILETFEQRHEGLKTYFKGIPSAMTFYRPHKTSFNLLSALIQKHTHLTPVLSTSGGTSDARFMKDICPILEFGLINQTAHHVNECVALEDLKKLSSIYFDLLSLIN